MPLTCDCDWWDPEPGDWFFYTVEDYAPLDTRRGRKCSSCHGWIRVDDLACKVPRAKVPKHQVEVWIYGDDGEIPIAPMYMCERCADLWFSLDELGFCVSPSENMLELVKEYAAEYGPTPPEGAGR